MNDRTDRTDTDKGVDGRCVAVPERVLWMAVEAMEAEVRLRGYGRNHCLAQAARGLGFAELDAEGRERGESPATPADYAAEVLGFGPGMDWGRVRGLLEEVLAEDGPMHTLECNIARHWCQAKRARLARWLAGPPLAARHAGMRVSAVGMLGRAERALAKARGKGNGGLAWAVAELAGHLRELGDRYYREPEAADEFLQLYALDGARPSGTDDQGRAGTDTDGARTDTDGEDGR